MPRPTAPSGDALQALLATALPGARLLEAHAVERGVSAAVLDLRLDTAEGPRRLALRVPPDDEDLDGDDEARLLRALRRHDLPVPEPVAVLAADPARGLTRSALLTAWVDHDADASPPRDAAEQLGALVARLHALPLEDFAFLPAAPEPALPEQLPGADADAAARLLDLSRAHPPPASRRLRLCHRDAWPGNVLWKAGRIAALVDWEEARIGDPIEELAIARLEWIWEVGPEAARRFTETFVAAGPDPAPDPYALAAWDLRASLQRLAWLGGWGLPPPIERATRLLALEFAARAAGQLRGQG